MFYVDIPTERQLKSLIETRSPASVSIFIPTTAETQHIETSRIELKNMLKEAEAQLEAVDVDSRVRDAIAEQVEDLYEDEDFWAHQSNSLAIYVTPDKLRAFRLPTRLEASVHVSDRFHIKPILRVLSRPEHVFVLALEENDVRLIEVGADGNAHEVKVSDLPDDAASAVGKSTLNDRSHSRRVHGDEGQKLRLRQYCRKIDAALRPFLAGHDLPLVVVATEPLGSLYQSVTSYPRVLEDVVDHAPAGLSAAELAELVRPVVDGVLAKRIAAFRETFEARGADGRAVSDISDAARAATFGAVETLIVDIDAVVPGLVDRDTGAVTLDQEDDAVNYGVVDEIAARVLRSGGEVIGARAEDIPNGGALAAVLRYTL